MEVGIRVDPDNQTRGGRDLPQDFAQVPPELGRFRIGAIGVRCMGRAYTNWKVLAVTNDNHTPRRGSEDPEVIQSKRWCDNPWLNPNLTSVLALV